MWGGAGTLEVSLYETTNEIRFRYLDTDFGNATFNAGRSATSGVENQTGTQGTQYSRNQAVLTNGKAISCSQGAPPPASPHHHDRRHHHRHHPASRRRHHRRHRRLSATRRRHRHHRPALSRSAWAGAAA